MLFALGIANAAHGETLITVGAMTSSAPSLRFGALDTDDNDASTISRARRTTALIFEADARSTKQQPWLGLAEGARLRVSGFAFSGNASSLNRILTDFRFPIQSWHLGATGTARLLGVARRDQRQSLGSNTELGMALFGAKPLTAKTHFRVQIEALARADNRLGYSGGRTVQALSLTHNASDRTVLTAQIRATQTRLDNPINNITAYDLGLGFSRRFQAGTTPSALVEARFGYRSVERGNNDNQQQPFAEASVSFNGPAAWTTKLTLAAQNRSASLSASSGDETAIGLRFERKL